jgi:hypothetical protein
MSVDTAAIDPLAQSNHTTDEPKYGGHSRFELELEVRLAPSLCATSR